MKTIIPYNKFVVSLFVVFVIVVIIVGINLLQNLKKGRERHIKLKQIAVNGIIIQARDLGRGCGIVRIQKKNASQEDFPCYLSTKFNKSHIIIGDSLSKAAHSDEVWFYHKENGKFIVYYISQLP